MWCKKLQSDEMNYIKVYLNSPFSLVLTPFFAVGLIVKEQKKIRIEIENANLMYFFAS